MDFFISYLGQVYTFVVGYAKITKKDTIPISEIVKMLKELDDSERNRIIRELRESNSYQTNNKEE